MENVKLGILDFLAIGLYFAAVIAAGVYAMCRSNRGTVSGYFLAGRFMTWLPVGASLFASNIGSEHFIGLAGSGAAAGVAVGAFELNACLLLQLLGWVFLPVYIASGVCTLPEYMKKRFGGKRIRIYLASLSLTLYIFTKISVNLYSGALFIQQALHWNLYIAVLLLLGATAITTVTGGLAAVIYTDTLQAAVMVIGAVILMILSLIKVGGYSTLYHCYMMAISNTTSNTSLANLNDTCGHPRDDSWTMLRDPLISDMPWPGFVFGQTTASIWYWCADQMMVQRTLAAKSLSHAQGGTLFAGYLKLLPVFLLVIPGMISRVLFRNKVACSDPDTCWEVCQNRLGCSNIAYPKLVLEVMPPGMKGVMLSVMLAALMSDLTSIFNSASTLFTMDIYRYIRKTARNQELMIVGRVFVCIMVIIGIVWIPVIQGMQGAQLYIYIQAIAAYLAPPIACVYLIAILWRRGNEKGAFWALMVAMVIGVTRMILGYIYPDPSCGSEDDRPVLIAHVHYMYFALFLFLITGIIMVIVSLCTDPPDAEQIVRTTYWSRFDKQIRDDEQLESHKIIDISTDIHLQHVAEVRKRHLSAESDEQSRHIFVEVNGRPHTVEANGKIRHLSSESNGKIYSAEINRKSNNILQEMDNGRIHPEFSVTNGKVRHLSSEANGRVRHGQSEEKGRARHSSHDAYNSQSASMNGGVGSAGHHVSGGNVFHKKEHPNERVAPGEAEDFETSFLDRNEVDMSEKVRLTDKHDSHVKKRHASSESNGRVRHRSSEAHAGALRTSGENNVRYSGNGSLWRLNNGSGHYVSEIKIREDYPTTDSYTAVGDVLIDPANLQESLLESGPIASDKVKLDEYDAHSVLMTPSSGTKLEDRHHYTSPSCYIASVIRHGVQWFCGLNSPQAEDTNESREAERVQNIMSLEQTTHDRTLLCVALVVLLAFVVLLFAFFCTGSSFGLVDDYDSSIHVCQFDIDVPIG